MQWVVRIISKLPTPAAQTTYQRIDKGKRPISVGAVKTRGGHTKRVKVVRDKPADLSSLPFSESHDTRQVPAVIFGQTSSLATDSGTTRTSSAPHIQATQSQATTQISAPTGIVGPTPSTVVHTGLPGVTNITTKPSTSTLAPRTSAHQEGCVHFMTGTRKLLSMDRNAVDQIQQAVHSIIDTHRMHTCTYQRMYEEVLSN
ncbi:hypothetical protein L7F22_032505 [Adiantum nelumboides]|nr:hypothetical protein [Adiantum nelumboides]